MSSSNGRSDVTRIGPKVFYKGVEIHWDDIPSIVVSAEEGKRWKRLEHTEAISRIIFGSKNIVDRVYNPVVYRDKDGVNFVLDLFFDVRDYWLGRFGPQSGIKREFTAAGLDPLEIVENIYREVLQLCLPEYGRDVIDFFNRKRSSMLHDYCTPLAEVDESE